MLKNTRMLTLWNSAIKKPAHDPGSWGMYAGYRSFGDNVTIETNFDDADANQKVLFSVLPIHLLIISWDSCNTSMVKIFLLIQMLILFMVISNLNSNNHLLK